jgi:FkbM family methyltransferase
MARETILALTSLPPAPESVRLIRDCIGSWRSAGLEVLAFNHPSEIANLRKLYDDVEFVPVVDTTEEVFGSHLVPLTSILRWVSERNEPVLVLNSDITLQLADWELKRIRWLADGGLCYIVRYNHNGVLSRAAREVFGIDAFLFHGRHAVHLPESILSIGQPFWDYWLPHAFAAHGRPLYSVEFPAGFHLVHHQRWSWGAWHRCAVEFARVTGEPADADSFHSCMAMADRVRRSFEGRRVQVPRQPRPIVDWVRERFRYRGPKVFLDLGSGKGDGTAWMARIPDVTIHAFEPDPRNVQAPAANVTLHRAAIADRDGLGTLILSLEGWGQEWTHSSSIKTPKNHLHRFPVTFGDSIEVELRRLDTFYRRAGLGLIDFAFADIQGAEGEMIRGGRETLAHTRYLYTEYSDDELYEGQATLADILALLPDFRVVELWPEFVLLENRALLS